MLQAQIVIDSATRMFELASPCTDHRGKSSAVRRLGDRGQSDVFRSCAQSTGTI